MTLAQCQVDIKTSHHWGKGRVNQRYLAWAGHREGPAVDLWLNFETGLPKSLAMGLRESQEQLSSVVGKLRVNRLM